MSSTIIAATIRGDDNGNEAQIALLPMEDKTIKYWVRSAPKGNKPIWTDGSIPASYWPALGVSQRRTAVGTLKGMIVNKLSKSQKVTLGGAFLISLSEEEQEALTRTATPAAVFNRVAMTLDQTPPRSVNCDTVEQAMEWLLDGPIIAVHAGESTDEWCLNPVEALGLGTVPTKHVEATDPRLQPVQYGNVLVRPYWMPFLHNGQQITTFEFIQSCYVDDNTAGWEPQTIFIESLPGTGKTTTIGAALKDVYEPKGIDFERQCVVVCTGSTTEWDIVGQPWEDPKTGKTVFRKGKLPFCMENGVPFFADEWAQAKPSVWSKTLSALDARGMLELPEEWGGNIYAQPGFGVIFSANYGVKGATVFEPLFDRGDFHITMETNWDVLLDVIGPEFRQLVTAMRIMDQQRKEGLMMWSPQFRQGVQAARAYRKQGGAAMLAALMARFRYESDRVEALKVLDSVMNVSRVPAMTM